MVLGYPKDIFGGQFRHIGTTISHKISRSGSSRQNDPFVVYADATAICGKQFVVDGADYLVFNPFTRHCSLFGK